MKVPRPRTLARALGPTVLATLALSAPPAIAAPGDPVNQGNFTLAEVTLQSGKTLLAGTADSDLGLIRLNADGSPDPSFDVEGFVRADFGAVESAADIATTPSGRILIAGTQSPGATPVAVIAAFNSNGNPDTSLDGDGKATFPLAANDLVTSVDVGPTGRIALGVAAGNGNFKVIALTSAGAPDPGFGTGGVTSLDFGAADQTNAVAFQSSGKVIAAGGTTKLGGEFAIARFGLNGAIDNLADADPGIGFANGSGAQEIDASAGADAALAMAIDSTDRIVLSGPTGTNVSGFPISGTVRLVATGVSDGTFAGDGKAEFPEGFFSHYAQDVAVTGTGDILVSGVGNEAIGFGYLQRLSDAGAQTFASTDTGAGGAGYETVVAVHVAGAADGGYTLGGHAYENIPPNSIPGGFAQRFTAADALDPTLAGDGTTFPRFAEQAPPVVQPPAPLETTTTKKKCKKRKGKKSATAAKKKKCKKKKRR